MPSFDIVSEIDMQEVRNAVENATRDLGTRWDFRNVPASFELNEKNQSIKVATESDFQVQQLLDILREKLSTRSIDGGEGLVSAERLLVQSTSSWQEAAPAQKDVTVKTLGEFTTGRELFEIGNEQVFRIRLYIWVEGQDVDCYGLPEDARLLANIQFENDSVSQSGMVEITD